jgi:hypothetical protein
MIFDVDFSKNPFYFFAECYYSSTILTHMEYGSGTLIYFFVKCIYCIYIPPGIVSIMWKIPGQRRKEDTICPITVYNMQGELLFLFDLCSIWTGFLCAFLVFFLFLGEFPFSSTI